MAKEVIDKKTELVELDDGTTETIYSYSIRQPNGKIYTYKKRYNKKGYNNQGNNEAGGKTGRCGRKPIPEELKQKRKEIDALVKHLSLEQLDGLGKLLEAM